MNQKRAITFVIIAMLALLVAACTTTEESEMPPGPAGRPDFAGGTPGPGGGPMGFMNIISQATGLSIEELQEEGANGATLAEIITAHGGDVEAVKAELIQSMSQMPDADEATIRQRVDDLLNNPPLMRGPEDPPEGLPDGFGGRE
jgi:hypothetical protein